MTREEAILHMTLRREELKHSVSDLNEDIKAFDMAIKALEQQPCEDAISRQAVDDAICDYSRSCDVNYQQIMEFIEKIPPITPQPKMGHWIDSVVIQEVKCSECRKCFRHKTKYCPECGAKMQEVEE